MKPLSGAEIRKIVVSMTAACALGAAVLGGVFIATDRYAEEARVRGERRAVSDLLGLSPDARVLEVDQSLAPGGDAVVYRTVPDAGPGREVVFSLDGALVREGAAPAGPAPKGTKPLGRLFVATRNGAPDGFVTEGEARGYKNKIRFFVGITAEGDVSGVRVLEHEEDPGLGAEVATPWFTGQFSGRGVASIPALDVTRDPMPEDWRAALRERSRLTPAAWATRFGALAKREGGKPIYAVTGATISSRALTDGVRATIAHFERRWALVGPHLSAETGGDR
ncbi:MAG TPA: FMN-binding protein [Candidatus Eisenbacteria bacterium]